MQRSRLILPPLLLMIVLVLSACGASGTPDAFPTPALTAATAQLPQSTPGPVPGTVIRFPEDEAPHNVITEWWYYTGNLITTDGQRYGVEYTIFQGSRSDLPVGYAAHFAIIDAAKHTFSVDQDLALVSLPKFGGAAGFDLRIHDWTLRGVNGTDTMQATMRDGSFGIDITATDRTGPTLQGGGQFSYGAGGSSYYYSRTRMIPSGTITVGGQQKQIAGGTLWFDHQWGNFLPTNGGWDWYSTQLDDGSAMMVYNLRDAKGTILQTFGEYVPPCASDCAPSKLTKSVELEREQFTITSTGTWKSETTGITYPVGWRVQVKPKNDVPALDLMYTPVIPGAELDTRKTTSVVYWEGDNLITGTKNGTPITGSGYIELTGYDKQK